MCINNDQGLILILDPTYNNYAIIQKSGLTKIGINQMNDIFFVTPQNSTLLTDIDKSRFFVKIWFGHLTNKIINIVPNKNKFNIEKFQQCANNFPINIEYQKECIIYSGCENYSKPSVSNFWKNKIQTNEIIEIGRASCRERVLLIV